MPRPTKTPPLIDLTLNETEICKDLDIVPKPVRSSLLPSTPQITSKYHMKPNKFLVVFFHPSHR
jgi:hypothetical protein